MAYTLVKGQLVIHYPDAPRNGPEPDGDTIKFRPEDPRLLDQLARPGHRPDFNREGMVSIRFEAIDALETHFNDMHQQLEWALRARDRLLDAAGFGKIEYFAERDLRFKVRAVQHHPRPGYILTRSLDQHGRVVAFVYAGSTTELDGAQVFLKPDRLQQSINAMLLKEGLAFPTFYDSLPADLRRPLAELSRSARHTGLWPLAAGTPTHWAQVSDLRTLETLVMFPKLFRRLALYFAAGNSGLNAFEAWLRADPLSRDDALLLPDLQIGNLHDIVEVSGNTIRLNADPEDFVILESGAPAPVPVPIPPRPPLQRGALRIVAALVNPIGTDAGAETVSILNTTPSAVDLARSSVRDRSGGRQMLSGTVAPGEVLRLKLDGSVKLSNTGDDILLFEGETLIDQVAYGPNEAARQGFSLTF